MAGRVAELEPEVERARQEVDELRCRLQEREDGLRQSEAALALERARVADAERAVAMGGGVDALPPPGLGDDELPDEVMLRVCSFLGVRELGRLGCVSQRFAEKSIAAPSSGEGEPAAAAERLSLAEEAARRWVEGCSEQERGWVPQRGLESRLRLVHEVGMLRLPLAFGRAHASVTLSENGAVATKSGGYGARAAASKAAMRSGRHFAQITVVTGEHLYFGVIRLGFDVEGGGDASCVNGHCLYYAGNGQRYPGASAWEGMQTATEQGDRIGMLLALDQGSMTVWKNGEQLGVMVAEGLTGPLCWAVSLYHGAGTSARIESVPAPPSPTEEELAAAKAWQVARAPDDY